MRILVIEPLKEPYAKEIDGSLNSMQSVVGGSIQAIYPFEECVALICHEEGKLIGLPPNRALFDDNGQIYDIISGTFFLCSAPPCSDSFEGLSDEQINTYSKRFEAIEIYLGR